MIPHINCDRNIEDGHICEETMMLNMLSVEARYLYIYCLVRSSMHTKVRADREVDIG